MRAPLALARHELRLLVSLGLWIARRRHGTGSGTAFGYARGQGAMMFAFGFVCVIEAVMMAVLLRNHPAVHRVVLMLDVYTLVLVAGMHAASVVRPHVLDGDSLRVRRAAQVDLRIPLEKIAHVRRELRTAHERADGAQTSVTLELTEPVAHFTILGRRRHIRLVRLHADDADGLVQEIQQQNQQQVQQEIQALKQARNAPSPLPELPA